MGPGWGGRGGGYAGPVRGTGAAGGEVRLVTSLHFVMMSMRMKVVLFKPYLTDVTSQFRAAAARHIRDPRKPLPPKTTILFVADIANADGGVSWCDLTEACKSHDDEVYQMLSRYRHSD